MIWIVRFTAGLETNSGQNMLFGQFKLIFWEHGMSSSFLNLKRLDFTNSFSDTGLKGNGIHLCHPLYQ